jgi:hypothetical protein
MASQQIASAAFTVLLIGLIAAAAVGVVTGLLGGPGGKAAGAVLAITAVVWALMMFGPSNPLTQALQQYLGS